MDQSLEEGVKNGKKPAKLTKAPSQNPNASSAESKSTQTPEEVTKMLHDFLMSLPGASKQGLGYQ